MNKSQSAANALTSNLREAVARVREDVEKVEFWADAVSGFTQPVPAYKSGDVSIWVPNEQARRLTGQKESDSKRTTKRDDKRCSASNDKYKA